MERNAERRLLWPLYKDINPGGDSWKALFPAEVFTRGSKIPQGIGTICITICCCLSGDPRDRILIEKNPQFWVQPIVETDIGVQFVGAEEGGPPVQHYFVTGNQWDPHVSSSPKHLFFYIGGGWCPFSFSTFGTGPHGHFPYSLLLLTFVVCFVFIFGDPPNSKVSPFPFCFTILPFHPGQWLGLVHKNSVLHLVNLGRLSLFFHEDEWRVHSLLL